MNKNPACSLSKSILIISTLIVSCNNNVAKDPITAKTDTGKAVTKESLIAEPEIRYERPPIINIVDTVAPGRIIAFCKDSAATFERIGLKLGNIYGTKLATYIKKYNLKTAGAPMAWYKSQKAPYFFDAGIPINKRSSKFMAGVHIRELKAGHVVVAHFYGPYEFIPQGYEAIKEWMKDNKKTATGPPYEMYVMDPYDKNGKPLDAYKVQTDIVFPIK